MVQHYPLQEEAMADPIISTAQQDAFITDMIARMTSLARHLAAWATAAPHSLQGLSQHVGVQELSDEFFTVSDITIFM